MKTEMPLIFNLTIIIVFLSGCNHTRVNTLIMAQDWFLKNDTELFELKELLTEHQNISRVDSNLRIEFVPGFENFNKNDIQQYKKVVSKAQEMGIENITVIRESSNTKKLRMMSFTLYSQGIIGGGKAIGIDYVPDRDVLTRLTDYENQYFETDKKGWYIQVYQEYIGI